MRDRPTFDELEAPPVRTSRIDGLTDEEWAARRLRRERNFRIGFGLAFGFLVGTWSVWHWGLVRSRSDLATALVIGGSMLLFSALFAQRRDDEAVDYAGWVAFPEWKAVEKLPWWALAFIAALGLALLAFVAGVLVMAHFPHRP